MAEVNSVQKGNKYEIKKREKKEKERKPPKLTTTGSRLRQSRETAQGKKNYEEVWKFLSGIIAFFLVLFVLLGGINQRKTIEALKKIGITVGQFVSQFFEPYTVNVNDDGVYLELKEDETTGEIVVEDTEDNTKEGGN